MKIGAFGFLYSYGTSYNPFGCGYYGQQQQQQLLKYPCYGTNYGSSSYADYSYGSQQNPCSQYQYSGGQQYPCIGYPFTGSAYQQPFGSVYGRSNIPYLCSGCLNYSGYMGKKK
ncbi:unnamed protein product [Dracunculus medinensis]|uniref:Uncharacterized protein n=1 Tax=Dracunculus medinensis TaxID=318479 RepID=A0A0N4UH80_DRAME|nr:unnamed protein product [Dracunculus medinensis]